MKTEAALVSKRIKKELKELFPNVKFSVTSSNYSGGNSVRVEYNDFLPASILENHFEKYEDGKFDSSQDLYEYKKNAHEVNANGILEALPRTKYLFFERRVSPGMREEAKNYILTTFDCAEKHQTQIHTAAHRLTVNMDLSFGFDKKYAENFPHGLFDY
jgi:hypothetical protein